MCQLTMVFFPLTIKERMVGGKDRASFFSTSVFDDPRSNRIGFSKNCQGYLRPFSVVVVLGRFLQFI
jgi:hypothetical protein